MKTHFRALRLGCALLAISCGGGNDAPSSSCGHSPEELVGGWRGNFSLRACFAADHRMWIGDSTYELESRSHCTTTPDSCRYECTDLAGGSPYGGALEIVGEQLQVRDDDCLLGPGACVGAYLRDATLSCE